MERPIFLLGVGAQKAGTSWLADYLRTRPDTAMGPVKEMHFFNCHFADEENPGMMKHQYKRLKRHLDRRASKLVSGKDQKHLPFTIGLLDAVAMHYEPERYRQFYAKLMDQNSKAHITGDITPDYAAMSDRGFAKTAAYLKEMPFRTKVVFIMRDPAERLFSAFRMRSRTMVRDGKTSKKKRHSDFVAFSGVRAQRRRTEYEKTIARLEQNFAPDQLCFLFFEELFREETAQDLCTFLDLPYIRPELDKAVNAGGEKMRPTADEIAAVREKYAGTYDAIADRFGRERIEKLWAPKS